MSKPGILVPSTQASGHRLWVRICHWLIALSFLTLAFTGFMILMVHPRLYWGEVGNDLIPALLELPISNNHRPEGWREMVSFAELPNAPISANRTYETELFNENGWARSLHFLAGWLFVSVGAAYVLVGLLTGHVWRDLVPRARELLSNTVWHELKSYARLEFRSGSVGPPYGLVQKCVYATVALIVMPFMVMTGLSMSPAVSAAYPVLLDVLGGYQSARTLHFAGFTVLTLFLIVHVTMVTLTGFRKHLRAMTIGS
jgi:thiosulfate reductase cytochrome b subunit